MRIRVHDDAARAFWADLCRGTGSLPHWAPHRNDWVWRSALEQLQGKDWPAAEGILRGVADCVYVLAATSHEAVRNRASVVALPDKFVAARLPGESARPPAEYTPGRKAWWLESGMEVVRLLTPWTDDFMAFVRRADLNDAERAYCDTGVKPAGG